MQFVLFNHYLEQYVVCTEIMEDGEAVVKAHEGLVTSDAVSRDFVQVTFPLIAFHIQQVCQR